MKALTAPLLAAVLGVVALSGCGDDTTTSSPSSSAPSAGIPHPTGADAVVLRIGYQGGMLANARITEVPTLVIAGDGTVYTQAVTPAIYPGPLMPPVLAGSISEAGLQRVLRKAEDLGLLAAPRDYSAELNIADAPDTVVVLHAANGEFEHRAYALGINAETSVARQDLFDFVTAVGDLHTLAGDVDDGQPYVPISVRLAASPVDRNSLPTDVPPQFVDWPGDADVDLAAAASCAVASSPSVVALLTEARQTTYFVAAGITYLVQAAPVLPGDSPC